MLQAALSGRNTWDIAGRAERWVASWLQHGEPCIPDQALGFELQFPCRQQGNSKEDKVKGGHGPGAVQASMG